METEPENTFVEPCVLAIVVLMISLLWQYVAFLIPFFADEINTLKFGILYHVPLVLLGAFNGFLESDILENDFGKSSFIYSLTYGIVSLLLLGIAFCLLIGLDLTIGINGNGWHLLFWTFLLLQSFAIVSLSFRSFHEYGLKARVAAEQSKAEIDAQHAANAEAENKKQMAKKDEEARLAVLDAKRRKEFENSIVEVKRTSKQRYRNEVALLKDKAKEIEEKLQNWAARARLICLSDLADVDDSFQQRMRDEIAEREITVNEIVEKTLKKWPSEDEFIAAGIQQLRTVQFKKNKKQKTLFKFNCWNPLRADGNSEQFSEDLWLTKSRFFAYKLRVEFELKSLATIAIHSGALPEADFQKNLQGLFGSKLQDEHDRSATLIRESLEKIVAVVETEEMERKHRNDAHHRENVFRMDAMITRANARQECERKIRHDVSMLETELPEEKILAEIENSYRFWMSRNPEFDVADPDEQWLLKQ